MEETKYALVVDNEDSVRKYLERLLDPLKIEVLEAVDGEQGLELASFFEIDLIISDFAMPGLNGLKFLKACRKLYPQLPFIVISRHPQELIDETDNTFFLSKPFNGEEVVNLVDSILNKQPA